MADVTRQTVLDRLSGIPGPDGASDIVGLGMVSDIFVEGGKVMFSLSVPAERAEDMEPLRKAAERAVASLDGVERATVALTAERKAGAAGGGQGPVRPAAAGGTRPKALVPGIDAIVAVASGKGGVGKSTTAVNLALGLRETGLSVGLLDADIYGPSMPRLLGLNARPEAGEGRMMKPLDAFGLKVMSMGFLVAEEAPMIWRGPMVMSALTQMLREVEWGQLDVLVVDMPPGTGDAQLTMAQQVPMAGAVIVSTPQDLALIDARKGLNMFRKVNVPILGIVENMSTFICPSCGHRSDIFGHGGARHEAEKLGVPFLGEVPLHLDIRQTSDAGRPVVAAEPEGVHAGIYRDIALRVRDRLAEARGASAGAPKIVFE